MISRKISLIMLLSVICGSAGAQSLITYIEGDVFLERNSKRTIADFGMEILEGDSILTGEASLAILELEHGRTIKMGEESRIQIESLRLGSSLQLESGSVFARVDQLLHGDFTIHTESVVAGVRGTEFFMAYGKTIDEKPDIWLCVNEGSVMVSLENEGGESVLVNEGEGINIPGSSVLTEPEAYAWTKDLNWNTDPAKGDVRDRTDLDGIYSDLLDQDYF